MYQQMFLSLLPAMAVCMMAACSYFAFYLCGVALRRRAAACAGICRPFSELKADKSCVFAVVIFLCGEPLCFGCICKSARQYCSHFSVFLVCLRLFRDFFFCKTDTK